MKRIRPILMVLLLLAPQAQVPAAAPTRVEQGSLIYDGVPMEELAAPSTLARWLESRPSGFLDWLADGSLLVGTRFADTTQLHRLKAPLDARTQLTFDAAPVTGAIAHPYDANLLVYQQQRGANPQLWLREIASGNARLLTDGRSRHGRPVLAHDGKRLAFSSNARNGTSSDIYVSDISSEALPRLVFAGGIDTLQVEDWSLDDSRVAVIRRRSASDSELLLIDVMNGSPTRVEPAADYKGGPMSVSAARFARDGRGLYFLSDRGGEFTALHYIDLYTRELRTLTADARADVERFTLGQDGRFLAYTLNEAGGSRLVLRDLSLKADVLPPPLPAGALIGSLGFDRTGRRLALSLETAQSPSDVYVYELDTADTAALPKVTLTRWTQGEVGPIDPARLVPAQRIQFPTWDRANNATRLLPAFLYRPSAPGPRPVIIDLQDGADSQSRPGWNAFRQYLVNELGYAVIAPDLRGASGHGRSFLALDDGEQREDAVRDVGALLVWIGLQSDLDRNRVVVMGGANGGYLALSSLIHYGERLAGGIVSGPAQVKSQLADAAWIRKQLLIVQGLDDPAVPAGEAEQMMALVRARGGEVWYLAARDEDREFRRKASIDARAAVMAAFLRRIQLGRM
jgi:dipeptidyl aminopeptidase/acylaminoacyl peptidase